jgi:hypothetical protein
MGIEPTSPHGPKEAVFQKVVQNPAHSLAMTSG